MLSLASLAGWEEAVLASIAGATGTLIERDQQIERSGMYGEYPAILHAYEELFGVEELACEAYKRALFLVWRGAMESPALTGIAVLPEGTVRDVIDSLDDYLRSGGGDEELELMLAWYHATSPDLLGLYGASAELVGVAASRGKDEWRTAVGSAEHMRNRGQMGRYWAEQANGAP